jgi:PAS domain S-box-containing protein
VNRRICGIIAGAKGGDDVAKPPQSEIKLEEFFDLSIDPLSIVGFDGEFRRVSASFLRLLGYSKAELFSQSALNILHPDDVEPAREALARLAEGHDLVGFEARVVCADGSVRWLEWNTRSILERGVVYTVGRDTTERRLFEVARNEVERLATEQAALRRVATLVAEGAPPTAVFDAVAGEMEALLGADRVSVSRYEPGAEIAVLAHRGSGAELVPTGSRLSLEGSSVQGMVWRTERPARMDNFDDPHGPIAEVQRTMGVRGAVAVPVVVDGRVWGVIGASWVGKESPPVDTEERMAQFAGLLETAIANADSRGKLDASRARLVTEADEARRRVVRDLHDGAQQRLVSMAMTLKVAEQALREGDGAAELLLSTARELAKQAGAELRELAHGIFPSELTEGGLRTAVGAVVSRLDLDVRVDIPGVRFPPEIEASTYLIVAEALTNVVKHAHAEHAEVTASVEDGTLCVEVSDDGVGGADVDGHGLVGLGDRAAALGGRLQVTSPPGGGTLLSAALPLPTKLARGKALATAVEARHE